MLGHTLEGRYIKQYDVFIIIGSSLRELIPEMKDFWSKAKDKIHIDTWQKVTLGI